MMENESARALTDEADGKCTYQEALFAVTWVDRMLSDGRIATVTLVDRRSHGAPCRWEWRASWTETDQPHGLTAGSLGDLIHSCAYRTHPNDMAAVLRVSTMASVLLHGHLYYGELQYQLRRGLRAPLTGSE